MVNNTTTFGFLWALLETHGVVPSKKAECARLWDGYTLQQQRDIYRSIRDKLRAGRFVHYDPVKAVRENAPKQQTTLSFNDYYNRFGTTEELHGWHRLFLPQQQKTIYVKTL